MKIQKYGEVPHQDQYDESKAIVEGSNNQQLFTRAHKWWLCWLWIKVTHVVGIINPTHGFLRGKSIKVQCVQPRSKAINPSPRQINETQIKRKGQQGWQKQRIPTLEESQRYPRAIIGEGWEGMAHLGPPSCLIIIGSKCWRKACSAWSWTDLLNVPSSAPLKTISFSFV